MSTQHVCEKVVCDCDTGGESVTSFRSVDLDSADLIAQLRAHRIQNFADYLTAHWPPDVAEECDAECVGTDCVELKLPEDMYCPTCKTYARICREWYALPEIQNRLEQTA